ncbi:MAG: hypothetical protein K9M98_13195 [Cephaloticoccus sp.]|nr:hypothetical protein [Cephaloticoccus sp.]MCF7761449.1 hypothetical protein [Cephaloticoccus sp.]
MSINYFYLLLALLLLWIPRHWLRVGRRAARALGLARRQRKREFVRIRESGDNRVNFTEEFSKPRNYIDFLRALVGGLILIGNPDWGISSCFHLEGEMLSLTQDSIIFNLQIGIVTLAIVRQFVRYEGRMTFYAPLFFMAGLAFGLCGFGAGFFAFLLVWTFNSALPIPPVGFLTVYILMLWLLSLLFQGISNSYVYATAVIFLIPVVVSLMARRSLALFNKKIK